MSECKCHTPPLWYRDYNRVELGMEASGHRGEAALETCKSCGAIWLNYLVEYEHLAAAGRWFRGIIPPSVAKTATPETALAILESLDWWLYGGSHFATTGSKAFAPLHASLLGRPAPHV